NGVPIAGGANLGQLTIQLRVRPAEPPANSFVRFGLSFLNSNGSIKASFDSNVHYDLNVSFYFFSINKSGDFSLRDAPTQPTLLIDSASAVPGTPDGQIVYEG